MCKKMLLFFIFLFYRAGGWEARTVLPWERCGILKGWEAEGVQLWGKMY